MTFQSVETVVSLRIVSKAMGNVSRDVASVVVYEGTNTNSKMKCILEQYQPMTLYMNMAQIELFGIPESVKQLTIRPECTCSIVSMYFKTMVWPVHRIGSLHITMHSHVTLDLWNELGEAQGLFSSVVCLLEQGNRHRPWNELSDLAKFPTSLLARMREINIQSTDGLQGDIQRTLLALPKHTTNVRCSLVAQVFEQPPIQVPPWVKHLGLSVNGPIPDGGFPLSFVSETGLDTLTIHPCFQTLTSVIPHQVHGLRPVSVRMYAGSEAPWFESKIEMPTVTDLEFSSSWNHGKSVDIKESMVGIFPNLVSLAIPSAEEGDYSGWTKLERIVIHTRNRLDALRTAHLFSTLPLVRWVRFPTWDRTVDRHSPSMSPLRKK